MTGEDNKKKEQEEFDRLFDDLFKKDDKPKEEKKSPDEELSDDFMKSLFSSDSKDKKTEDKTAVSKEEKKDDDDFTWLKDLIDEIDKEEAEKKKVTAAPVPAPVRPSFTSKLREKPRPPKPPEHIQTWGSGKKIVTMPATEQHTRPKKTKINKKTLYLAVGVLLFIAFSTAALGAHKYFYTNDSMNIQQENTVVMTRVYSGDKILIDTNLISDNGKKVMGQGYVDAHISNLMYNLLRPGDKVVDVGSGFGYYTLYLARIVGGSGQVYAFEARKSVFELLESSIKINNLTNVQAFNNILFSERTKVLVDKYDRQKRSNFGVANIILQQEDLNENITEREISTTTTLDDMLSEVKNVSLLHINAHGSELSIILGAKNLIASSPKIKIITSWSKYQMAKYVNIHNVVSQLLDNGFRFWLIKSSSGNLVELTKIDHIMQVENGRFIIAKTLT
jgi:FkbM family methyltransferase